MGDWTDREGNFIACYGSSECRNQSSDSLGLATTRKVAWWFPAILSVAFAIGISAFMLVLFGGDPDCASARSLGAPRSIPRTATSLIANREGRSGA